LEARYVKAEAVTAAAPEADRRAGSHASERRRKWRAARSSTAANVHDAKELGKLLHGEETRVYGARHTEGNER
jgi:IS5 family transposase